MEKSLKRGRKSTKKVETGISRSHFQRVFKQETGLSPADFVVGKNVG